jgi:integrase
LRYRIGKKRFAKTFHGTLAEAKKELRALLRSGDTGEHVAPVQDTLAEWAKHWIAVGAPGRRRKANGGRSVERYDDHLRVHILPTLGEFKLQEICGTDIDNLYLSLEGKISPRSIRQIHSVLNACLGAAVRTRKLALNPCDHVDKVPARGESDHGTALEDDQLRKLIQGFRGHDLFAIVSTAAARRNEILALRWSDLDPAAKTLRIERALEETKAHGIRFNGPKKDSHKRTITIDDDLIALLLSERERHLRLKAGIPDGVTVDLSLIKLPEGALMFPNPTELADGSFTSPRSPRRVSKYFQIRAARIGFRGFRFHDLRGTHETKAIRPSRAKINAVAASPTKRSRTSRSWQLRALRLSTRSCAASARKRCCALPPHYGGRESRRVFRSAFHCWRRRSFERICLMPPGSRS